MSENFAQLFDNSFGEIKQNSIVSVKVKDIQDSWVVVDFGLKSESFIAKGEFVNENGELEVAIGDEVKVVLDKIDDGNGYAHFSREKARKMDAWALINSALETGEVLSGVVISKIRAGYQVDINGVVAFLPGSLVDNKPAQEITGLEGTRITFKVLKIDKDKNNILISRKAVIDEEGKESIKDLSDRIMEGAIIEGTVKNITNYGVFVDLGGIDGLLHTSDMDWKRVKHPSELFSVGQKLAVKVLSFDKENRRVSLGLKQLTSDPWEGIVEKYKEGDKFNATITNLVEYGAFAEIADGVEGLIHASELDWLNKNVVPEKILTLGQVVPVMVIGVDKDSRRISLSMKKCLQNPWEEFAKKYKEGDKLKGPIKSITDFGLFVSLDFGLDGLVHISDVDWGGSAENMMQTYKKGDEVEVVISSIDLEKERVALSIKALKENHYVDYFNKHEVGEIVKGVIKDIEKTRAVVELEPNILASVRLTELKSLAKVGDSVELKISNLDNRKNIINLVDVSKALKPRKEMHSKEDFVAMEEPKAKLGDIIKLNK